MSTVFGLRCPNCGLNISDNDTLCPHCGTDLETSRTKAGDNTPKPSEADASRDALEKAEETARRSRDKANEALVEVKQKFAELQTEFQDNTQEDMDDPSDQQPIDGDRVDEEIIIRRQWMALVAFFFFLLAGAAIMIYTITNTNSLKMPEVAKYSFIGGYLSLVYISLSSIKNQISIARQGGVWDYAKGMPAIIFGVIFFILATLYLVVVLDYFFGTNFFSFM